MSGSDPDNDLVRAWDEAQRCPSWQRPAALVAGLAPVAAGTAGAASLENAPVGVLARRALETFQARFGPAIAGVFSCRVCGAAMEASLTVAELLRDALDEDPGPFQVKVEVEVEADADADADDRTDGVTVLARLPSPADVAAAAAAGSPAAAVRVLLERTVVEIAPDLDVLVCADALSAAWEARDPLGVVSVEVSCPACGTIDTPALDVAQWCWAMADAQARRLLDEVHVLASAYGWSEHEILALGPYRRGVYLEWAA